MNSLDKMEDYDRLARLCKAKDFELQKLREEIICHENESMMQQAKIQMLSEKLKADVARLTDFVHDIANEFYPCPDQVVRKASEVLDAILAKSPESDIDQAKRTT
jgi:maltooligosyltrehalose synthase